MLLMTCEANEVTLPAECGVLMIGVEGGEAGDEVAMIEGGEVVEILGMIKWLALRGSVASMI